MPEKAPELINNVSFIANTINSVINEVEQIKTSIIPEITLKFDKPQKNIKITKETYPYNITTITQTVESKNLNFDYVNENTLIPATLTKEKIKKIVNSIKFVYNSKLNKFTLKFNDSIVEYISFSPQLSYFMRFLNENRIENNEMRKYSMDIKGGIHSFGVYAKDITENIICGLELVSLLRLVTITGTNKFGDTVENIYNTPIYLRVLPKQLSEIEIKLRTVNGDARLIPFHYGTTTVVLVFKKVLNF